MSLHARALVVSLTFLTCAAPQRPRGVDRCGAQYAECVGICPAGFLKVGERCEDIDECATNRGGCDLRTSCTNTSGARECGPCPPGFEGDGAAGCREPHWPIAPDSPPAASFSVAAAGMVEHRATGLVWQRSVSPTVLTWRAALDYCAELTLGGHGDWRLPTLTELSSISDLGRNEPAIDPEVFPDTPAERFWSISVDELGRPWALDFSSGLWGMLPGKQSPRARCVRQGRPAVKGERYLVSADTVFDRTSGLTWQRAVSSSPEPYTPFKEAEESCRALRLAGFSDWRLPTLKELMSLLDAAALGAPTIDPAAFPATPATPFWSSSPSGLVPDQHLIVSFFYGTAGPNRTAQVRCVR